MTIENHTLATTEWRQRLVPVDAAAAFLGVSRATVERLARRGQLPIVKVAGATRYDVEDLNAYVARNRRRRRNQMA